MYKNCVFLTHQIRLFNEKLFIESQSQTKRLREHSCQKYSVERIHLSRLHSMRSFAVAQTWSEIPKITHRVHTVGYFCRLLLKIPTFSIVLELPFRAFIQCKRPLSVFRSLRNGKETVPSLHPPPTVVRPPFSHAHTAVLRARVLEGEIAGSRAR